MDYPALLRQENDLLADVLKDADLELAVPTCPGWSLLQLLKHVGRGHRWAAQMVEERATQALDPRKVRDGRPPQDRAAAVAWLRAGAAKVLEDVAAAPDAVIWTFTGPKPATWWVRRRLHEATVHRADVALTTGTRYDIAPQVAADGIEEWLTRLTATAPAEPGAAPLARGVGLAIETTDTDHGWLMRATATGLDLSPGSSGEAAALVGTAADLLLALTRRRDLSAPIIVRGDPAVVEGWLANTPF